ncbi:FecR family protein [Spirosoma foliorum]|uniref:FecR domain-containing protein n=1 Tax=Spirosoma foliorum TaxID=2710596 RepID=A0A7G5H136_9BACT|nr:FecR domain-containing protein [Spirosoma foliorum]QMW04828.1 FecR domain-containing protein [Spirosoma foliorum]
MRSYELFSTQDFITDDAFIAWVTNPTQASNSFWLEWVQKHPYKQAEIEEAAQIIRQLSAQPDVFSDDELQQNWKLIQQRIAPDVLEHPMGIVIPLWRRWYAIAASVAVLIMVGAGFWWYQQPVFYSTAFGKMHTVVLPDSSLVTLNGNSCMEYKRSWSNREVKLTGEAFFQVRKQRQQNELVKFTVKTARLDINVVGTVFNVNDRRGKTEVMLAEGKVQLNERSRTDQHMILVPGEKATLLPKTNYLTKEKADPRIYTAWLNNTLIFNGETLNNVFQKLEDSYGIRTTVSRPELLRKRFTGSVGTDSIQTFYNQLQTIYNVRARATKGGYLID